MFIMMMMVAIISASLNFQFLSFFVTGNEGLLKIRVL